MGHRVGVRDVEAGRTIVDVQNLLEPVTVEQIGMAYVGSAP